MHICHCSWHICIQIDYIRAVKPICSALNTAFLVQKLTVCGANVAEYPSIVFRAL